MLNKISIRWRFTIFSAFLLSVCSLGLTFVLNLSAFTLADSLEQVSTYMPNEIPLAELPSNQSENEETPIPAAKLGEAQAAKVGFSSQSIMYMLLVVLGGSALTYYIAGKALKPLDLLCNEVKQLSVQTLSKTMKIPSTNDEIAELTKAFNDMSTKLDSAFATQKRFSVSAAHEFRTPLAVLQTKVDVFNKKNGHSSAEYNDIIDVFEKQISRLRSLVNNLLDMTNMSEEQIQSTVELKDAFEDIISELQIIAKSKNIKLKLNCDDAYVIGNVDLLYRAFYNLVENAIKYNVEGGSVLIKVKKTFEEHALIEISDTGQGISDDAKLHIFEPFYRADNSRDRSIGGAGLGLAIVYTIIKQHKGSISVSDNASNGTCFKVVL